jgi:hypothetical protein
VCLSLQSQQTRRCSLDGYCSDDCQTQPPGFRSLGGFSPGRACRLCNTKMCQVLTVCPWGACETAYNPHRMLAQFACRAQQTCIKHRFARSSEGRGLLMTTSNCSIERLFSSSVPAKMAAKLKRVVISSMVRDNGTRWAVVGRCNACLLAPSIVCLINVTWEVQDCHVVALA